MTIVSTNFIHSVSVATPHIAFGFVAGLGSGALIGACGGAYLALSDSTGQSFNSLGDFSLVGAIVGGVIGLIAGPILAADDRTVYVVSGSAGGW